MVYLIIIIIICIFVFVFIDAETKDTDKKIENKTNKLKNTQPKITESKKDENKETINPVIENKTNNQPSETLEKEIKPVQADELQNFQESKPLDIRKSYLMTNHEKTMFGELRQSVPECNIFVQVSFSAILWSPSQATRNKYNRKIIDFVITDQNFNILAVIELDDKSHDTQEQQEKDQERDNILKTAGYKVLRYRYMPPKDQLRKDILS